jgi:DNA topoisomerase-2
MKQKKKNEREVTFVPGLFKIFDEIIINASAKKKKNKATPRWTNLMLRLMHLLTLFQSPIIRQRFWFLIIIYKEHHCYVPTLIFGHLLTVSNFNDKERKATGGCYYYGVKLANIFSTDLLSSVLIHLINSNFRKCSWNQEQHHTKRRQ